MDINDHIIRTHLMEAEFSAVCDISRDNYSQAVRADERKRKEAWKKDIKDLFNVSIVSRSALEMDPRNIICPSRESEEIIVSLRSNRKHYLTDN